MEKNFKNILIIVIIIIIVLGGTKFLALKGFRISTETLLWLFSTIVQGFVALIAFVGVLAIYKLQVLENISNDLCRASKEAWAIWKGGIAGLGDIEMIGLCKGVREADVLREKNPSIKPYAVKVLEAGKTFRTIEKIKGAIKADVFSFLIITITLIFLSLIFLILNESVYSFNLDVFSVLLTVCLVVLSLLKTIAFGRVFLTMI